MNIQKAIENGPVEIVDFPIKHGGSFHGKMLVHQRVPMKNGDLKLIYLFTVDLPMKNGDFP